MTRSATIAAIDHLRAQLAETAELIGRISDERYRAPCPGGRGGAIGAHLRHCLDHIHALVQGVVEGTVVGYEQRRRGTAVECDRREGLQAIDAACEVLIQLADRHLDETVLVAIQLAADEEPRELQSTIGRELAFLVSHGVHHDAMIARLLSDDDCRVPEGYGYAPATRAWMASGD